MFRVWGQVGVSMLNGHFRLLIYFSSEAIRELESRDVLGSTVLHYHSLVGKEQVEIKSGKELLGLRAPTGVRHGPHGGIGIPCSTGNSTASTFQRSRINTAQCPLLIMWHVVHNHNKQILSCKSVCNSNLGLRSQDLGSLEYNLTVASS